ncbi:MAG TPA: type II secretion system F family protein [Bauldia sp.]|nr:type II secretion system F family protein [Bauldia sp.]
MFGGGVSLIAIVVLAALSAGGLAYGLLYGRIQDENTAEKRLEFIQGKSKAPPSSGRNPQDPGRRRKSVQETLKELDEAQKAKAKQSKSPPLSVRIQQAGLSWSRRTFWIISVVCGLVALLISWRLGAPLYLAVAFGAVGLFGLPRWYVNRRRKRRIARFVDEFANAVDVIVRGVKAGLPLNDCIRIIGNEAAEPVKSEFRQISETQALGLTLADAVARLPDRVPTPEASFFAIVIAIQQRAGGNLAEALGNLSRVLRERKKMKGKIGAMAMEAKASAYIIGSLPLVVMGLVFITSPKYILLLFTDPIGHLILVASVLWMTCGVLVMRKMINFDF